MIQILINLIGPIFYGLGVSEADFVNYMNQLSGYIYAIFASIIALIIILIGARFFKKSTRKFIRSQSIIAFLLILVVIVNMISFGPLHNNIAGIINASDAKISEETKNESKEIVKKVGAEGFVLLKNEGLLPVTDNNKLNVFGWASTAPIYGGTGSGSSDTSNNLDILQSFANAGFETNEELTKIYKDYQDGRVSLGLTMTEQSWELPEPTAEYYTQEVIDNAKAFSDTAVIVIGRSGGEGADLPMDMRALIDGTYNIAEKVSTNPSAYGYFGGIYKNNGDTPDFEAGESYLELSKPEKDMIKTVTDNFKKVVVVINASNPMELSWVDEYEEIGAVIYAPGAGVTGFDALGKIVNGTINPSGKTVDTFLKDVFNAPYINNIGSHIYTNVDDLTKEIVEKDNSAQGVISFVNYAEGIYVGYKFYETAHDEGFINYDEYVQYPFGYGLSYTEFEKKIENFNSEYGNLSFDVVVKNTGSVAGKSAVELYYTPPYTNGGIEKASVNLVEFAKTKELAPGESETLSFKIEKEELASYDSEEIKVAGGGYILEAGKYDISVREDSHTVLDTVSFEQEEDIIYSADNKRTTDEVLAINRFDYARGGFEVLSRKDKFANYETATKKPDDSAYLLDDEIKALVRAESVVGYDYKAEDAQMPIQGAKGNLQVYDMAGASYDDERWESLINQMSVEDMTQLINIGGWQTAEIKSIGKIATVDADGPAGLNNFITRIYGTSYPAEVLMAQTWNKDLLAEIGYGITKEFAEVGYYGWYAPAVNTHRSPFAGRNFEYFSEDGVLAGKLAAAELNGSVENKVYAYIKHFALNDQETNRNAFLLTYSTEQAIREIYLKPFEIAIKNFTGTSQAVMSAFNFIGTVSGSSNPELLNDILRDEWGFRGMVITDYDGSYGYMISDKSIKNGNDLMLGFGSAESDKFIDQSAGTIVAMRKAVKNILYTIANSGAYATGENPAGKMDNMTRIYLTVNIICLAILVILEILIIRNFIIRKREENLALSVEEKANE